MKISLAETLALPMIMKYSDTRLYNTMKNRVGFGCGCFTIPREPLEELEYDMHDYLDLLQCGEETEFYFFPVAEELTQACVSDDDTDPGDQPEFVMLFKE